VTVTADQLRDAMVEISAIEKKVSAITSRPITLEHAVSFSPGVSAVFDCPSLESKTPTWVNGGPNFWCAGISYSVWWARKGAGNWADQIPSKLFQRGNGFSGGGYNTSVNQMFDFRWSVSKLSNKTGTVFSYVTAPGSVDSLLSSNALGNQETGRHLSFSPWLIERGDSLVFTVKPIGYTWGAGASGPVGGLSQRFSVLFTMHGVRDQGGAK
jgi:hypothetical protein